MVLQERIEPHDAEERASLAGAGLKAFNFRKISENGFGDPYNAYPHSMTWFQDHLYVGTTRATLAHRGRWRAEDNPDWLGEVWPVKIPKKTFDIDLSAEIWRYHPPTDKWTRVFFSPKAIGVDGFEVPRFVSLRSMIPFRGASDSSEVLYVPAMGSHQTPDARMLRSVDGTAFEVVAEPGLGFPYPFIPRGIRALISFNGRLFTSPAAGAKKKEMNTAGFMIIGVTDDPAVGNWQLACEPNFGNPNNLTVFDMAVFNGYLYAGTLNVNEGFEIWKSEAHGSVPYKWKKVVSQGAYRGKLNQMAMTMRTFKGHLYVGSAIQEGGCDRGNGVGPAPPEIIRLHPDDTWDIVVGSPRMTPQGLKVPLSGLLPGFGNPFAGYLWSMCEHEGWLYAGTFDWLLSFRYSRRALWPKTLQRLLSPKTIENLIQQYGGCDLWRSRDGCRWSPVTQNGFGNYYNYGVRTMVSSPHGLFVGLANPYGPEVAVKRAAGWRYEYNPKGGLEIYAGTQARAAAQEHANASPGSPRASAATNGGSAEQGAADFDDPVEGIIARLYEGSRFRHIGYWGSGIGSLRSACENMVEEVLAFLPARRGTIADIGCGLGATTQSALRFFPRDAVTGIVLDKAEFRACRSFSPHLHFLYRKKHPLFLPPAAYDSVIWFKGLHWLEGSSGLLAAAFQALRPGGHMACFDMLSVARSGRESAWPVGLLRNRAIRSPEEYLEALAKLGFIDIRLIDVTEESLEGFRNCRAKYFSVQKLSGTIEQGLLLEAEQRLMDLEDQIGRCLLVSAGKPPAGNGNAETAAER